jgi:hypothetical protein
VRRIWERVRVESGEDWVVFVVVVGSFSVERMEVVGLTDVEEEVGYGVVTGMAMSLDLVEWRSRLRE